MTLVNLVLCLLFSSAGYDGGSEDDDQEETLESLGE